MNFQQFNIRIPVSATGDIKTICPNCTPHDRKPQNRNSKDLSVNVEEGIWNCHNCGWKGSVNKGKAKKEYTRPIPRLEKVSGRIIGFFESRGISNDTLLRAGITEAKEWMPQFEKEVPCICFNYYRGEDLVNIKFRGPEKSFKLAKDAELVLYNLNSIESTKDAVIVEGEMDCLTLIECGIYNAVSVPNGASKGNQRLDYLDNCWEWFEGKERVIIAVDNDEAGTQLKEELARRLGKERVATVVYPEGCKDANDVLQKCGRDAVKDLVRNAVDWPIEGIVTMDDMYDEVAYYYEHGYPKGTAAHIPGFDDLLLFAPGELSVNTGIPGSGKDEFCNMIMANLSKFEGWPWAIANFEEPPSIHVTKLAEKISGKAFGFRKNPDDRMSQAQFEHAIGVIDQYFFHINLDQIEVTMDGILEKAKELVKKKGIKGLLINPWNYIEHNIPKGQNETQYVSQCLTKLVTFLKHYGVHGILIAHPTKILKDKVTKKYEVPTLYSINGSSHFFNKTYNGWTTYRDFETGLVTIYVQKVKFWWNGHIGYCDFNFNTETRQYNPI